MRVKRIEVSNFRALRNSALNFSDTTALLGENNCGKSAFLLALDLFFSSSPRVKDTDYSDRNIDEPIDITLHFSELTPSDREEFTGNLLDEELVVTRRFVFNNAAESGKYFVSARVNPDFSECRSQSEKSRKRALYKELRDRHAELPKERAAEEIDGFLEAWEANNPSALKIEKVASFKGWTNVAAGKLKQKTSFVLIRAVQDANEDIQESKNSPVKALVDTIARQTIQNSQRFKDFIEHANKEISDLTDPKNVPVLSDISEGLTELLTEFYRDSAIIATWDPIAQIQPTFPSAHISIEDNSFITSLDGVGHGLQRAVILTVLRFMADHRAKQEGGEREFDEPQSDLILAIEEPEIYQHPTKQRLFAKLLHQLSQSFNKRTGIRVQTIFVTHSPLLVSIGACEGIRMLRLRSTAGNKNVEVKEISLEECARRSAIAAGKKLEEAWSASQYAAKLHTFTVEIAEGFFAKCVILVEGVGDKAILEAWYKLRGRDPYAEGIVVAQVGGKNNLDRPIVIFQALGIPCYWIFDNDQKDNSKQEAQRIRSNRLLQNLAGRAGDKCVDWPDGRYENFASWDSNLEKFVAARVGQETFSSVANEFAQNYGLEPHMVLKFPASASGVLLKLTHSGATFPELDDIVGSVDRLLAPNSISSG